MIKLKCENKEIKLYINDIEQPLKFGLDIVFKAEKKFGTLFDAFEQFKTWDGCIWGLTEMINAAIKAYNDEYNGNEKPVTEDFTGAELNVQTFMETINAIVSIRDIITKEIPDDNEKNAVTEQEEKS